MKNQISLDIKKPCSENYKAFAPTAKGGFCSTCTKEVIDFTHMNAQETIAYFKNNSAKNTCGRFNSSQLKTYNIPAKQSKKLSFLSGIGLACLSLLSLTAVQGQVMQKKSNSAKDDASKIINQKQEKVFTVKGTLSDYAGPLPGANILLEGTEIGTQTDFDGHFTFPKKLKQGDVLVFSYVGFKSKKVVISSDNETSEIELKLDMEEAACFLVGKVAVKKVYTSKN